MYSLRPSINTGLILVASGTIEDGTPVILLSQTNIDAPPNVEFTFFSTDALKSDVSRPGETLASTGDELEDDGVYYIKASINANFVINVNSTSKEDGAKLIFYAPICSRKWMVHATVNRH